MTITDHKKNSITRLLSDLLAGYMDIRPQQDRLIGALRLNSQRVMQGDLFIALPGMTSDGRDYIGQALDNGAAAVLFEPSGTIGAATRADRNTGQIPVLGMEHLKQKIGGIACRFFGNPSHAMTVIGITGTNGKTTAAYLIAQGLTLLGWHCGYSGTIGCGFIGSLQPAELTTMDVISTHRQLHDFLSGRADSVCMEVSSHGLDQGRVNGVNFDTAVFTNLSRDHLDYHHNMSDYGDAKRRLFKFDSLKTAVINCDDEFGRELLQFVRKRDNPPNCISYGVTAGDVRPIDLVIDDRGIGFGLQYHNRSVQINAGLLGAVNVPNILCAIGCLLGMGYGLEEIASVIARIKPPPGRMEVFRHRPDQPAVIVDYAHTPDGLERALESLKSLCRGKLIVVFGCGGDRDRGKRPLMGTAAESIADRIILTDDNPRSEPAEQIVEQIQQGLTRPVTVIHDRKQAVAEAISSSAENDLILLAGKGHETTQTMGAGAVELSDRVFVPALLEALS